MRKQAFILTLILLLAAAVTLPVLAQNSGPQATPNAPAASGKQKGGKQKEMTDEERRKIEEENKKIEKENANIKVLNAAITQARTDLKANPPNIDNAITTMEQATAQAPNYDLGWATLGDAYLAAKKWPQAVDAYTKAIGLLATEAKPDVAPYHNNLGKAYGSSGQGEKAIEEYTKAAQIDPGNASMYYFNAGATLTNNGKLDDANAAFDKCIQAVETGAKPADPALVAQNNSRAAMAYFLKGSNLLNKAQTGKDGKMIVPPGTSESLNKYLELAPDGPRAPEAKAMLEAIGAPVATSYGVERKKKK